MVFKNWIVNSLACLCVLIYITIWFLSYFNDGTWYINILAYAIPLFFGAALVIMLILALFKRFYLVTFLLFCLFLLHKPLNETLSIGYLTTEKPLESDSSLNVMTFNVSTFNNHRTEPFEHDDSIFTSVFFEHLQKLPEDLDIICLQEFHHDDAEEQRIVDEIVKHSGNNYFYTVPIWQSWNGGFFGIITLSKYPIINKGTLFIGSNELNRGIFTDIIYKKDTIRIINIHLHSMNIRWNNGDSTLNTLGKINYVLESLKDGSVKSKGQIDQVLTAITESKYPVILCGDFNTFPYGYAYQKVKKLLNNSFEDSGKGFGFTLNLPPYFVRLDNQFTSKEFIPFETVVIKSIKNSDHYPLISKYSIRK